MINTFTQMTLLDNSITFLILALIILSITSLAFLIYYKIYNKKNLKQSKLIPNPSNIAGEGGIVFVISFLFFYWLLSNSKIFANSVNFNIVPRYYIFFISLISLGLLSYIDDKFELSKKIRFIFQLIFCYISLSALNFPIFDFIPIKLEYLIVIFVWVYIINTTNFIDGLNGVLASNGITFFIGSLIIINHFNINDNYFILINFITLVLIISFFLFNFPKPYIFFGDTGSISLGFIIGYVIIYFFSIDIFLPVVFLYIYPLLDVSLTLIHKTFIRKKLPWARLFDYYFLKPVINNYKSHSFVTIRIILNNVISLIFLILYLNQENNKILLVLAILSNFFLIFYFDKFKKIKA